MPGELFTKPELAALEALRARFLGEGKAGGNYWQDEQDLALYDASFGERIGWKWDTVIEELRARRWAPRSKHVVDWGCGSGIAGRRAFAAWDGLESLTLTDISSLAMRFAERRAREEVPGIDVRRMPNTGRGPRNALLLVSHVLNELAGDERKRLLAAARSADEIMWIEAGTHADSRRLIEVREELREDFTVIAPCTHQGRCGMLTAENSPHWCHHFAEVPARASQDARWAQFGRELGIDLRSLPFSFLVLQRGASARGSAERMSRIIGRPREAKARMEILSCDESGVRELMLQKRDAPSLFKQLKKGRASALQCWSLEGRRIAKAGGATDSLPDEETIA
jgi:ribosomal protein RSM22 (predicted rRNA methylase)